MNGYVFIAGVLWYLFLLRALDSTRLNPAKAAALLIGGYYGLLAVVLWIDYSSKGLPALPNIFTPVVFMGAFLQFFVAMGIFYKIEEGGDEYMSYLGWGAAGLVLIFYIVPIFVQTLLLWL